LIFFIHFFPIVYIVVYAIVVVSFCKEQLRETTSSLDNWEAKYYKGSGEGEKLD